VAYFGRTQGEFSIMFNFSKQTRTLLFFLAMGLVPATIGACDGGGAKAKDQFEIVTAVGIVWLLGAAVRKPKTPALLQIA
jgi:hypothetical protein